MSISISRSPVVPQPAVKALDFSSFAPKSIMKDDGPVYTVAGFINNEQVYLTIDATQHPLEKVSIYSSSGIGRELTFQEDEAFADKMRAFVKTADPSQSAVAEEALEHLEHVIAPD